MDEILQLREYIETQRYGDALYSFVQALLRITDVSYLSRERVRSTFIEDFRTFMTRIKQVAWVGIIRPMPVQQKWPIRSS